jgi:hypothetical protein
MEWNSINEVAKSLGLEIRALNEYFIILEKSVIKEKDSYNTLRHVKTVQELICFVEGCKAGFKMNEHIKTRD